jgi:hypothetical protein
LVWTTQAPLVAVRGPRTVMEYGVARHQLSSSLPPAVYLAEQRYPTLVLCPGGAGIKFGRDCNCQRPNINGFLSAQSRTRPAQPWWLCPQTPRIFLRHRLASKWFCVPENAKGGENFSYRALLARPIGRNLGWNYALRRLAFAFGFASFPLFPALFFGRVSPGFP